MGGGVRRDRRELRQLDPKSVVFYSSGRASLEASYMYQLIARLYGNNNLPDSSNMCHESTSVALPQSIGVPVGTVIPRFRRDRLHLLLRPEVGINSPRMLHDLQEAGRRGVPIVTFNPLRERGLIEFVNPQSPSEMLTGCATRISSQYHQLKAGGDKAAITGLCKACSRRTTRPGGGGRGARQWVHRGAHPWLRTFVDAVRTASWPALEHESGLTRAAIEAAAEVYARRTGDLHLRHGADAAPARRRECADADEPAAAARQYRQARRRHCPVRGHSNVQGQRTVGITEKPELAPLDQLAEH